MVHRDIKPANIMYELDSDTVKVTDFGIARITDSSKTKTGLVLGTPSFMSPEQIAGKKVDGRSDLYSLGVMLFQMLTGVLPFRGDSMAELMYKIANEEAPGHPRLRPDLPERAGPRGGAGAGQAPGDALPGRRRSSPPTCARVLASCSAPGAPGASRPARRQPPSADAADDRQDGAPLRPPGYDATHDSAGADTRRLRQDRVIRPGAPGCRRTGDGKTDRSLDPEL